MVKNFKHLAHFCEDHKPDDKKMAMQVLMVIVPMLLAAVLDLVRERPYPTIVACSVAGHGGAAVMNVTATTTAAALESTTTTMIDFTTTMAPEPAVGMSSLSDATTTAKTTTTTTVASTTATMTDPVVFAEPSLGECFLHCPNLANLEYDLLENNPPGGTADFWMNVVILILISILLGSMFYRVRRLQRLVIHMLAKGIKVSINRRWHITMTGICACLVLAFTITKFKTFHRLTQDRTMSCPEKPDILLNVELDADYSFSISSLFVNIGLMALFAKSVLLDIHNGYSDCFQSISFKEIIKSPHRNALLEEIKHVKKVSLERLIEEVNRWMEPQVANIVRGKLTIEGVEYKVEKKYNEETISLMPTDLLDIILQNETLSLRVMESGELPSIAPGGDEVISAPDDNDMPAGYSTGYEKH